MADTIDLLLADRASRSIPDDLMQLVITGPDATSAVRDTAVVVRELFARAEQSILLAGYAVYQGQQLFQALAARMEEVPQLKVRLFLDIRRDTNTSESGIIIKRFLDEFRARQWPKGQRLPELCYFPASLDGGVEKRAAMHAKCIVSDRKTVFLGSANFTEAAHERNIELGLLIDSPALADRITMHFDSMFAQGFLRAAPAWRT
jgi:phosphatidylserine/phosphatidylglycerophosphate/cardiolipin synthase-like enzyme